MAKRGDGLSERNGVFYYDFVTPGGKRVRKSTGCRDRGAARIRRRDIELRAAAEEASPAQTKTLEVALDELLQSLVRANRSPDTVQYRETHGRHLVKHLDGRKRLAGITRDALNAYVDARLAEGVVRFTIEKELGTLRQAMRLLGVYDAKIFPDLGHTHTPRERWLPGEEYLALRSVLNDDRKDYLAMWCGSGMRESELYALRASEVDFRLKQVYVRATKSKKGSRIIPFRDVPEIEGVLRRRIHRDVMFPLWDNSARDLKAACKRARIAPVTCNDLRRTFCSWHAQMGTHPIKVMHMMGHTSLRMIERVYARLSPTHLQEVGGNIAGYLTGGAVTDAVPNRAADLEDLVRLDTKDLENSQGILH